MNKSKIVFILLILCVLLGVSCVSASDLNDTQSVGDATSDTILQDVSDQNLNQEDNHEILQSSDEKDVLDEGEAGEEMLAVSENSSDDVVGVNNDENNSIVSLNNDNDTALIGVNNDVNDNPIVSASSSSTKKVYINSVKTTYNSYKGLFFGWSGYFDGYFKIFKGGRCVHSDHLSEWDGDYVWAVYGLAPGTYSVKLIANGKTLKSAKLVITKAVSKISVKSFTTKVGTRFTCYAYVKNKLTGESISGGYVTFKINGKYYKAKVKNGKAIIKFKAPSVTKTYKCYASYSGGKYVQASKTTFRMKITPKHKYVTVTMPTRYHYVTKWVGNVKIQTYKFTTPSIKTVCIFVYKNGKILSKGKYWTSVHYKANGHWHWTGMRHGTPAATYHKYVAGRNVGIGNVKVKVWV